MDEPINQPQPNPIPVETLPQKKLNWKGFLIALLIVGALDIGALTVIHNDGKPQSVKPTPTNAQTASWKTYTSRQYPFTFMYPSRFQPGTYHVSKGTQIETITAATNNEKADPVKGTPYGYFNINLYPRNGSYEKSIDTEVDRLPKHTYKYDYKDENTTLNGISARKISGYRLPDQKGHFITYAINTSGYVAVIETYSGDQNNFTDEEVNQMLSSIKFTAPFPTSMPTTSIVKPSVNPSQVTTIPEKNAEPTPNPTK